MHPPVSRSRRAVILLCLCALLAALSILLGKFLALNLTEFIRISLENLPILLAGLWLGPWAGIAVGVTADLVGCLLVGYAINPVITLGAALMGLTSGLFRKKRRSFFGILSAVVLSHLLGSLLVKTLGLTLFYSLPFFATLLWRLVSYSLVAAAETALLFLLSKSRAFTRELERITFSRRPL